MTQARLLLLVATAWLGAPRIAIADDPGPPRAIVGFAATGSNEAYGLALDARLVLRSGAQLGVALAGTRVTTGYFAGRTIHGGAGLEATALALVPLLRVGALSLDLRMSSGVREVHDLGARDSQYARATRSVTELGLFANVHIGLRTQLRVGTVLGFEFELRPSVALADQMQLLSFGVGFAPSERLLLFATAEAGGTYGFDGNNGKTLVRSTLGLRIPFGGGDPHTPF